MERAKAKEREIEIMQPPKSPKGTLTAVSMSKSRHKALLPSKTIFNMIEDNLMVVSLN